MQKQLVKAIAAGAVVGFLGVGGMQLANAQEDPTTSTTVEESTDSTATTDATVDDTAATDDSTVAEDENCPNMGDGTGDDSPSADSTATDSDTSVGSSSL